MGITQVSSPLATSGRSIKRVSRSLLASVLVVALAGCASSMTRVETWEGEPEAASQAATLKTPGAIKVTRVNSQNMNNFLMDDLALDYALLPGENQVVFTHKTIWAKSGVVENGESKVHVYLSEPQVVRFNAEQDEVYRFRFPEPASRAEAEQMAETFMATVVTEDGQAVATSQVWAPTPDSDRTPIPASRVADSADGTALERLKAVWATATEDEKKAFLRWAFE